MLPDDVRALLRKQIGLGTRPQVMALGYGAAVVDGWVTRRLLEPATINGARMWGTYRAAGSAEPPEQQAMAAALRCRTGARVSGPIILGLLGVEGFAPTDPFLILVGRPLGLQRALSGVERSPANQRASIDRRPARRERHPGRSWTPRCSYATSGSALAWTQRGGLV